MNIIGQNGNDGIHYDLEEEKSDVKIIEEKPPPPKNPTWGTPGGAR